MSLTVDISKRLGDFQLCVRLDAGREPLALLGASGCGKSVTLKCIAGILKPDEGHIELDGRILYDSAAKINLPPQKRKVGYLFQQYALFPNMTVRQNIAVAVSDKSQRNFVTSELLRRFRLEAVSGQRPRQLSGGQQQRTALARIFASDPSAILLDEPFSALDSYLKYQLELEMQDTLRNFSGTILWVSHDRGEVWRNCPRVCVIDEGQSESVVSMQELFRNPVTQSAARLSGCKNYVSAIPDGSQVRLPDWNAVCNCGRPVPAQTRMVGIRSHHVLLAGNVTENCLSCTVERVIDDVFGVIVLLRPKGSVPGAPLLRMELSKDVWAQQGSPSEVTVTVAPENILLLK